jgi:hypothetical protein
MFMISCLSSVLFSSGNFYVDILPLKAMMRSK